MPSATAFFLVFLLAAPAVAAGPPAVNATDRLNQRQLDALQSKPSAPVLPQGFMGAPLMQQTVAETHIPAASAPR